jgi:hypothetical protein
MLNYFSFLKLFMQQRLLLRRNISYKKLKIKTGLIVLYWNEETKRLSCRVRHWIKNCLEDVGSIPNKDGLGENIFGETLINTCFLIIFIYMLYCLKTDALIIWLEIIKRSRGKRHQSKYKCQYLYYLFYVYFPQ